MRAVFLTLLFLTACDTDKTDTSSDDPCADLDLPECPPECPDDYASSCGEPCDTEGDACGNNIGDGRECVDGMWQCSVHAPLEPDGCNSVCE